MLSDYDNYNGDVNLECGGFFANLDDWKYGYAPVVRVTDLDGGCGFTGAVLVEHLVVCGFDDKARVKNAMRCVGLDKLSATSPHGRKMQLVDAFLSYGYYDPDDAWDNYHTYHSIVVQTDPDGPITFDGWSVDHVLDEGQDLQSWLEQNGHLRNM